MVSDPKGRMAHLQDEPIDDAPSDCTTGSPQFHSCLGHLEDFTPRQESPDKALNFHYGPGIVW